jgi:hypothetical protein
VGVWIVGRPGQLKVIQMVRVGLDSGHGGWLNDFGRIKDKMSVYVLRKVRERIARVNPEDITCSCVANRPINQRLGEYS